MNEKCLFLILLSIIQSNFCMDVVPEPELVHLDDGHEWTCLPGGEYVWQNADAFVREQKRYLAPFIQKVVALRSGQMDRLIGNINKINEDDPTEYVFLFDNNTFDRRFYYYYGGGMTLEIPSDALLRLITLKEAHWWIEALQAGHLWPQRWGSARHREGDVTCVTISNLMPSEQIKYFRNTALKTFWPVQRLLHIARKDPGSALYQCSKDVVRLIEKAVIDSEAHKLMKNADLNESIVPLPLTYKTEAELKKYYQKQVIEESQVLQRILYCKKKNIESPLNQFNQKTLCFLAQCIYEARFNMRVSRAKNDLYLQEVRK